MKYNHWMATTMIALTVLALLGATHAKAQDAAPVLNIGGVEADGGGSIKGIVKFEGRQANRKPVRMDTDPFCKAAHADTPGLDEKYVFGDNDTLQNVLVYVSSGLDGVEFEMPAQPAVLDQRGCTYVPHVLGVVAGQEITILNSDKTNHNVHAMAQENDEFNNAQAFGVVLKQTFTEPELGIVIKCDIHTWMRSYISVLAHPFFAVTQQDGTFEIKGLPAGDYELSTWHEFKPFAPDQPTYKVTVAEGAAAEVTITYAPKKKKK